jgi:hypothetical protein
LPFICPVPSVIKTALPDKHSLGAARGNRIGTAVVASLASSGQATLLLQHEAGAIQRPC